MMMVMMDLFRKPVLVVFRIDSSQTILRDDSGNHKLETTNNGVTITGSVTADGVTVGDNEVISLGNSTDLKTLP